MRNEVFDSFTDLIFRDFFQRKAEIDQREVIERFLLMAGLSPLAVQRFESFVASDEAKSILDSIVEGATNSGVFGVPSWVVEDRDIDGRLIAEELFFGQDRVDFLRSYLGLKPRPALL